MTKAYLYVLENIIIFGNKTNKKAVVADADHARARFCIAFVKGQLCLTRAAYVCVLAGRLGGAMCLFGLLISLSVSPLLPAAAAAW